MTDRTNDLLAAMLERANRRLFIGAMTMAGAVLVLAVAIIKKR